MILRICFIDLILKQVAAETAEAVFHICHDLFCSDNNSGRM